MSHSFTRVLQLPAALVKNFICRDVLEGATSCRRTQEAAPSAVSLQIYKLIKIRLNDFIDDVLCLKMIRRHTRLHDFLLVYQIIHFPSMCIRNLITEIAFYS
jgi:hypothetical protein